MERKLPAQEREDLVTGIAESVKKNYDESEKSESENFTGRTLYMDLTGGNFPVPDGLVCCDDGERCGLYVDELILELPDGRFRDEEPLMGISRPYDDGEGTYMVDRIWVDDLDDGYLRRLSEFAASHTGEHIVA